MGIQLVPSCMSVRGPWEPTKEQKSTSSRTSPWIQCRHCALGRGREWPHMRAAEEPGLLEMHVDLCFLGDKAEPGQTLPVMVVRERSTRVMLAVALPARASNSDIARMRVAFMKEVGVAHRDMVVNTDQDPAIMLIVEEVGRAREVIERSPGSSGSSGIAERSIQILELQACVVKNASSA